MLGIGVALGAFGAIPALHLIGHKDDHVHVGGSIVPLAPSAEHHHAEASPTRRDGEHPQDQDSKAPHGEDHDGGLAHFQASVLTPSAATLETLEAPPCREPGDPVGCAPRPATKTPNQPRAPPVPTR